jgi:hypothetical protein
METFKINSILTVFQINPALIFMCGGNQNTDLNQVTYKLYQVILYRVHSPFVGIFVTITDYISSCDSNYYVITVTT